MQIISPKEPLLERHGIITLLVRVIRFARRAVREKKIQWDNPWKIE